MLRQVGGVEPQLQRAGELQEARDQRVDAIDFGGDEAGHFARDLVFRAHVAGQHLGRRLDGAERIAQLMRQARRKLSERGQPVGPAHGFLGFLQVPVGFGELFGR